MNQSIWPDAGTLGTLTDLYQLTMMAGYHAAGKSREAATFELFVRKLPPHRSFMVFAGLASALGDLLNYRIAPDAVAALRKLPVFANVDPAWFDTLADYRFTGDIWTVPEGTVVFPGQPLVRVEAPLAEAQWIETYLIASLAYPTLVASKAARVVEAARGRGLFDFGTRRGHGPLAGMIAARASYLAGFDGTSNVEAAIRFGIPAMGTMAHSWIQSFDTETEAFAAFSRVYPRPTLLVDTYDIEEGIRRAAAIEPPIGGIRIDSGDLAERAKRARVILNEAGRAGVKIIGSSDLDESRIAELLDAGAPLDGFGVGTELITSRDAPAIAMVYKLVELEGVGRIKLSPGKKTYPCGKQIYRQVDAEGKFAFDMVTRADESYDGLPLLQCVVRNGAIVEPKPCLEESRAYCKSQLSALPAALRGLGSTATYELRYSDALEDEAVRLGVKQV